MKNYKLYKARLFKTGLVVVANQFGKVWVEFWFAGKLKDQLTVRHTYAARIRREDRRIMQALTLLENN